MDLADAQAPGGGPGARVRPGCGCTARPRPARPRCSPQQEQSALLAVPGPYDVPVFKRARSTATITSRSCRSLYSIPREYIGQYVDVRADSALVKVSFRGK